MRAPDTYNIVEIQCMHSSDSARLFVDRIDYDQLLIQYHIQYKRINELESRLKQSLRLLNAETQIEAELNLLAMSKEVSTLREQVEKLTKERDELKTVPMKYRRMQFNAELQDEVTQLQKQLAALAEQNEKMRSFFEFAWKDIPMSEYAFEILEHVMNLPNLAAPALNRIRAEGMRMAAQFIEDKYDFLGEEITVADEIRARADELEQSK